MQNGLAELFDEVVDCQYQKCYRKALCVMAFFDEWFDIEYVEGDVMADSLLSLKVLELIFLEGLKSGTARRVITLFAV